MWAGAYDFLMNDRICPYWNYIVYDVKMQLTLVMGYQFLHDIYSHVNGTRETETEIDAREILLQYYQRVYGLCSEFG